jgi:DNA repair exonuclease SbcCD nuclease subunit
METLEEDKKLIKNIIHISDVHIKKQNDRHNEYKAVFNNLFKNLMETIQYETSVIVITGDTLDNKNDLSPSQISLTKYFFINLSKITDIILILGNHETNNIDIDSLQPILQKLRTKNKIYILTKDKFYTYNNLCFGVTTMSRKKVLNYKEEKVNLKAKVKIGLYHGIIHGCSNDEGFIFNSNTQIFNMKDFNCYNYTLLGDVHKHQFLNKKMWYAGSLIQQNVSENLLDHGYVLLNLETKKVDFVRIKNNYGIIKIKIGDKINVKEYPQNVDLQISCNYNEKDKLQVFYNKLKKGNINIVNKLVKYSYDKNIDAKKDAKLNFQLRDQSDVINVIIEYIKTKCEIKDYSGITNKIKLMLREVACNFTSNNSSRKIVLKAIYFDNVMIYGKNNFVNFTKFPHIIGINETNFSGKSSFIDAILLSIFGISSRGTKFDIIRRGEKSSYTCVLLSVNNIEYKIEREFRINNMRRRFVKETIKIYENDVEISSDIKSSYDLISKKIISYEEFIFNSIVLQKHLIPFVEMNENDKRKFLCEIMNLNIFDDLFIVVKHQVNSMKVSISKMKANLKKHSYNNFNPKKDNFSLILKYYEDQMNEFNLLQNKNNSEIEKLELRGNELSFDILKLRDELKIDNLLEKRNKLQSELKDYNLNDLVVQTNEIKNLKDKIKEYKVKLSVITNLDVLISEYNSNVLKEKEIKIQLNKLEEQQKNNKELLNRLEKYVYNPKCKACMKNMNILGKTEAEMEYGRIENEMKEKIEEQKEVNLFLEKNLQVFNDYTELSKLKVTLKNKETINELIVLKAKDVLKLKKELDDINEQVKEERITKIKKELKERELEKNITFERIRKIKEENLNGQVRLSEIKSIFNNVKEIMKELEKAEKDKDEYSIIMSCLSKDGITGMLLNEKILPFLEEVVNNILRPVGHYLIKMKQIDNKIFLFKDSGVNVSVNSGYESHLLNLILKLAFCQMNSINKPTFMIIDEAFDSCAENNIDKIIKLIELMKLHFNWMLIISHNSYIKNVYSDFIRIEHISPTEKRISYK